MWCLVTHRARGVNMDKTTKLLVALTSVALLAISAVAPAAAGCGPPLTVC